LRANQVDQSVCKLQRQVETQASHRRTDTRRKDKDTGGKDHQGPDGLDAGGEPQVGDHQKVGGAVRVVESFKGFIDEALGVSEGPDNDDTVQSFRKVGDDGTTSDGVDTFQGASGAEVVETDASVNVCDRDQRNQKRWDNQSHSSNDNNGGNEACKTTTTTTTKEEEEEENR
jgi:hypothetical protein